MNWDLLQATKLSLEKRKKTEKSLDKHSRDGFVKAVRQYGKSDKGLPLDLLPWHDEYMSLIGDLRIHHTMTTGAAQVGKTLFHYLLLCYLVQTLDINSQWVYALLSSLQKCVSLQFKPIAQYWLESTECKAKLDSTMLWRVKNGAAFFSYTGGSSGSKSTGVEVSNSAASVSPDVVFWEEASQYPSSMKAVLKRRLDASRLDYKPIRELGTPGAGGGIENSLKSADLFFYPGLTCPHCDRLTYLDPKGALLLPTLYKDAKGKEILRYWNEGQQPDKFLTHDGSVAEAYIGCQHCQKPLSDTDRAQALFYDRKSGLPLKEFLEEFEDNGKLWKVGIYLSPLLRQTKYNLAEYIISEGANSENPDDWIQQALGLPTEPTAVKIDRDNLISNINASVPEDYYKDLEEPKSITLLGLDQGASYDYLSIIRYWFPRGWELMKRNEILDKAYREVLFSDRVLRSSLPEYVSGLEVEFGLIDNEPDKDWAAGFAINYPVVPADQIEILKVPFDHDTRKYGGTGFDIYRIRTSRYQARLVRSANSNLISYPPEWLKYIKVNAGYSPINHMCSVYFNDKSNLWERPSSHNDDIFFSFMFAEASFEVFVTEKLESSIDWYGYI